MKRSQPLESHMYGDPMDILAAKQARELRKAAEKAAQPVVSRPTLTLKSREEKRWSPARQAAEALFDVEIPPRPVLES